MIPLSRPYITEEEIHAVTDVLKSGRLSMGRYTELFEQSVAQLANTRFAVAVSSGTAALHLILKALDLKPGDYVIVPSFTFIASANVVLFEKAIPLFVDIDESTLNMSTEAIENLLNDVKNNRFSINGQIVDMRKVRFIMGVDIFAQPLDWDSLERISREWKLVLVEDSCEALGSEYKGKPCGSFGKAGAFAFYPNKQITTGEGGVITTSDEELAHVVRSLRNQGRGEGGEWLKHLRIGYNYRIDEMSAALGFVQLSHVDQILERRESAAKRYNEMLCRYDWVSVPFIAEYTSKMGWFVYVVKLDEKLNRDKIIHYMEDKGIQTRNYFSPVHLQPIYRKVFNYKEGFLPVTERISRCTLALPFFTEISPWEQEQVVQTLAEAVEKVG